MHDICIVLIVIILTCYVIESVREKDRLTGHCRVVWRVISHCKLSVRAISEGHEAVWPSDYSHCSAGFSDLLK